MIAQYLRGYLDASGSEAVVFVGERNDFFRVEIDDLRGRLVRFSLPRRPLQEMRAVLRKGAAAFVQVAA